MDRGGTSSVRVAGRPFGNGSPFCKARVLDRSCLPIDLGSSLEAVRHLQAAHFLMLNVDGLVTTTNLPMLLHWEDRNSMAFSVEAHVPFMDNRAVEFCLKLPAQDKLGGGISKAVLRRSMRGTVLDRRGKMGFLTAEPLWVKRDQPQRFRQELAAAVNRFGGMIYSSVTGQFEDLLAGNRAFDLRNWRVICAAHWAATFAVTV